MGMSGAILARTLTNAVLAITALETGEEVERATAHLLARTIGCDDTLHTALDLECRGAVVRRGPALCVDSVTSEALARVGGSHPAVVSYLDPSDDRMPRRISDVTSTSTWAAGEAYSEAFRERGERFQLSLVTQLNPSRGIGWVLTRTQRDFTAHDVEVATMLLPTLIALSYLREPRLPSAEASCELREALTPRELAVLELVATGAPALAVGRALGITESTVRKHLEHVYAKLGVHDRLTAVNALGAPRGA
jgi:DNA-binding CsgD family transcriptional regulator